MNSPEETSDDKGEKGFSVPSISLPKGGGAIRGMGEKFAANPVTGTGSMSVPIAVSPGRSGFGTQLSLSYDSGAGNGPFGFGWNLSTHSITRKTDKGLPQYNDAEESDVFILSGAEDLVPEFEKDAEGNWVLEDGRYVVYDKPRTVDGIIYHVRRYRPRIEGLFARIERWTRQDDAADVHWRSISKDNILTLYGKDENSRIFDPENPGNIFSWLICETRDDKGNGVLYEYKKENGAGVDLLQAHERNRGDRDDPRRTTNRYLKHIRYGNRITLLDDTGKRPPFLNDTQIRDAGWMFQVVFDYGEHDTDAPHPDDSGQWDFREDPFSTYRAGFEVRTTRLCQRVHMFHHFHDEEGVGENCLVRSTDFTYSHETDPDHARNPVYTFLQAVTLTGYKRRDTGYLKRSLPPLQFQYTQPLVQDILEEVDADSLENLPVGLDGTAYQWTDLHGEGIPGILTEQGGAWFYKRNFSPINETHDSGAVRIEAKFAPVESVAVKPNLALANGAHFMDLAGDGLPDLVVMDGPMPGLYEHDGHEGWQNFRPFTARLNRATSDPNLKFVDLDGDGHADVLITEDDAFVWHASLAEEGFGPARRVCQALDEEKGPRLVFADGTQSVYLADLSGDGLTDLARIRNGEVCYWPNLGYGRFGAKVTMDHSPHFDNPEQFDQKRIRLADIDGTGTTDIIYLHRNGVRLYFNQSGNSWSEPRVLNLFPGVDDLVSIVPTDLLGNGTACLVWSSPLPGDTKQPMLYVNLMGEQKPHLLVKTTNNLGAKTHVHYAPSTKFYLKDKQAGNPWITRLPFPVHVVERVETYDHISRNRFVTRYEYHHGYFDGEEREFRGFGMVEQWDTEQFSSFAPSGGEGWGEGATNFDEASHVPPVHTKTWFHTGAWLDRDHISRQFENEYYREPGLTNDEFRALLLPDTTLPVGLTLEEEREVCRALKGMMLRQEVYADDAGPDATDAEIERAGTPYTVVEQDFTIRPLQPRAGNRHAVFFTHPREAITYHYERNPNDPRIQHAMTLEVDNFGNVLKEAAIGYGRRFDLTDDSLTPHDQEKQRLIYITSTEYTVTNAIDKDADHYRGPLPAETHTYELRKPEQEKSGTGVTRLYRFDEMSGYVQQAGDGLHDIAYEDLRFNMAKQAAADDESEKDRYFRRIIEQVRTFYRKDDLSALLPFGEADPLALPGESYQLAFTPGLLGQVFQRDEQPLLPDDPAAVLGGQGVGQGGYVNLDQDGHWWIPSGRVFFHPGTNQDDPSATAAQELDEAIHHFYLPRKYTDPFGHGTLVEYQYDLLVSSTKNALENTVRAVNDCRVLQPAMVTDPNGNRSFAAFDALGLVVASAVSGKETEKLGDTIDDFTTDISGELADPELLTLQGFVSDPQGSAHNLLKQATTRIVYDLDCYRRCGRPTFAATLARETHVSDLVDDEPSRIQISFTYSDGFGREIQKKIQAEKGDAPSRDPEIIQLDHGDIKPGPLAMDNGKPVQMPCSHRWVGTGRTVFNNKGKPVKQYEPFFSSTHLFEEEREMTDTGVTPVLFYDPAGRVIATLHPNHTYEKVIFDPWQQTTFDVNDTVAPRNHQTGDPRTDPDISGYVKNYFKHLPDHQRNTWQTWYDQRISGDKGPHEQKAAQKAAGHADTPNVAHFDSLGRPFLTIAHNRVVCEHHDLNDTEDQFHTRVELDIEGNQRAVRDAVTETTDSKGKTVIDPLGRMVMQWDYSMAGPEEDENGEPTNTNLLHQASMEAGERWILNDAAGNPIRGWDSRGHCTRNEYDPLRRPVRVFVTGADPDRPNDEVLTERLLYGEQHPEAESLNLRGMLYLHLNQAGVLANEAHDFKGNLLHGTRRLTREYKHVIDWQGAEDADVIPEDPQARFDTAELNAALAPLLEPETFSSRTRFDALNRPIQLIAPHTDQVEPRINVIQPGYNEANLLERIDVWLGRDSEPSDLLNPDDEPVSPVGVTNIDYDAKGQRILIQYLNGVETRYDYDPETYRLISLYTRRGANFTEDCENPEPPPDTTSAPEDPRPNSPCGLQNLRYTYDPAGNITHIQDDAQQTIYFDNTKVLPHADYCYDALYRLIEATGREHLGQNGQPLPHSHDDAGRINLPHPNDGTAMVRYTERYVYDAVGNFDKMQHQGSNNRNNGWTRHYEYEEASLLEPQKTSNRLTCTLVGNNGNLSREPYSHDQHGNMTSMPHLTLMQWDYKDQLRKTSRQKVNHPDCTPEATYYVYDVTGQRVRKLTECYASTGQPARLSHERIYLGGFEIFRSYENDGNTVKLQRETLHIMDDQQRIALVETRTSGDDGSPEELVRYQMGNHLGSVSLELDEGVQIIFYEEYAPYGSTTYQALRSETPAKRYRYTGKERDEENGLNYHGARYYGLWLGRWISCEQLRTMDGVSSYLYADNRPYHFVDRSGFTPKKAYSTPAGRTGLVYAENVEKKLAEIIEPISQKYVQRYDELAASLPRQKQLATAESLDKRLRKEIRKAIQIAVEKKQLGAIFSKSQEGQILLSGKPYHVHHIITKAEIRADPKLNPRLMLEGKNIRPAPRKGMHWPRRSNLATAGGEQAIKKTTKLSTKLLKGSVKALPFVGIPTQLYFLEEELRKGNYGAAFLEGVGLIPGVGDLVDAARLAPDVGVALGSGIYDLIHPDKGLPHKIGGQWVEIKEYSIGGFYEIRDEQTGKRLKITSNPWKYRNL
ncbi:MAG: SpvB/TcaC N-terminal domain-containing protein [Desulfatiglandaceae bacterium]